MIAEMGEGGWNDAREGGGGGCGIACVRVCGGGVIVRCRGGVCALV